MNACKWGLKRRWTKQKWKLALHPNRTWSFSIVMDRKCYWMNTSLSDGSETLHFPIHGMQTDMHVQTCLCVCKCVKECDMEGGKAVPLECPLSLITSDYCLLETVDQACSATELMTQTNASHCRHIQSVILLFFFPGDLTKLRLFCYCCFMYAVFLPKHCCLLWYT